VLEEKNENKKNTVINRKVNHKNLKSVSIPVNVHPILVRIEKTEGFEQTNPF